MSNRINTLGDVGMLSRMTSANMAGSGQSSQALARRRAVGFASILANTTHIGTGNDLSKTLATRQSTAAGQIPATLTPPATALPATPSSPFAAAALQGAIDRALAAQNPSTPQPEATTVAQTQTNQAPGIAQHWYGADAADDAYWAKQPAAVQQLREIEDPDARKVQAAQLAGQGYAIDVPIMVWGFDAGKTTALRQQYGYTWVPSANQNPIELAPGLSFPGMQAYDPAHPPAGSIIV